MGRGAQHRYTSRWRSNRPDYQLSLEFDSARQRESRFSAESAVSGSGQKFSPPFQGLSAAKIVLISQTKKVEFDPLGIDHRTLEVLVVAFFDDKNAPQIQNCRNS